MLAERPAGFDELKAEALTAIRVGEAVAQQGETAELLIAAGDAHHLELVRRMLDTQSRAIAADVFSDRDFARQPLFRFVDVFDKDVLDVLDARLAAAVRPVPTLRAER